MRPRASQQERQTQTTIRRAETIDLMVVLPSTGRLLSNGGAGKKLPSPGLSDWAGQCEAENQRRLENPTFLP
jgi:hypothetical protein